MNPPATPGLHSGWLIDVPGFNPKHSEKKYAEFLKVDSVYELVEKYREDKKKTKKLLDKATSQFSKFDAHAARKFLKVRFFLRMSTNRLLTSVKHAKIV